MNVAAARMLLLNLCFIGLMAFLIAKASAGYAKKIGTNKLVSSTKLFMRWCKTFAASALWRKYWPWP